MRIRQLVADEATVAVWKSAFGLGILDHPGHAAMLFRSDLLPTIQATQAAERNYVEKMQRVFALWLRETAPTCSSACSA